MDSLKKFASDKGPEFKNKKMKNFCIKNEFTILMESLIIPISMGLLNDSIIQ